MLSGFQPDEVLSSSFLFVFTLRLFLLIIFLCGQMSLPASVTPKTGLALIETEAIGLWVALDSV